MRSVAMGLGLALLYGYWLPVALADVYEWEYINPAEPSQGMQQSSVLCPGGAGVNAAPGAFLYRQDLTMAYLPNANLSGADLDYANLTNAELNNSNLNGASLHAAKLSNANFSGAVIRGADFESAAGLTADQIYSTATYAAGDLSGLSFGFNDVHGWNFSGKILTGVSFFQATVTSTDFNDADVRGVDFGGTTSKGFSAAQLYSTASYKMKDLTGVKFAGDDLTGWDFSFQNLTGGSLAGQLTGANFAGAIVRGTNFQNATQNGFTPGQLYSTASYQLGDLTGIEMYGNNLTGWIFGGQNLTNANFASANLTNTQCNNAILTNVAFGNAKLIGTDLSGTNLVDADFNGATLTGANFANSTIRGADFSSTTGFSAAQLHSTTSYQSHDLSGINLGYLGAYLKGWNFSEQNLTNAKFDYDSLSGADFSQANLTNAVFETGDVGRTNFTDATIRGANFYYAFNFTADLLYSTASYKTHDLSGINLSRDGLTGWDFTGQNLVNANFERAVLTDAIFTGADLRGANLSYTAALGFVAEQLYSTASYHQRDLTNIDFSNNDLSGWDFAGQNLANSTFNYSTLANAIFNDAEIQGAHFNGVAVKGFTAAQLYSTASYKNRDLRGIRLGQNDLSGWNFAGQYLADATFDSATTTGADFSGADVRGALYLNPDTIINKNMIRPDGRIEGLQLVGMGALTVRNFTADLSQAHKPIPILIEQELTMDSTSKLQLLFDTDPWQSLISFAPGVPVALGGVLNLDYAAGVNAATQNGRTIRIFDWAGVSPTGQFTVAGPYEWDVSKLYTTGEITLTQPVALPGDFNNDGAVDASDYIIWRTSNGSSSAYDSWRSNFGKTQATAGETNYAQNLGSVPEPATATLLIICLAILNQSDIRDQMNRHVARQ